MKKHAFLLLAFIVLLLMAEAVFAVTIEAQGSAVITNGAVNKARLQAIQDAIRQAILQSSASVSTSSIMSANAIVMDNTRLRATGSVKNVVVLDEWQNEERITVLVRADVPGDAVDDMPDKAYRRKVAVMQFQVLDRRSIHDLANIEIEYPRLFMRRLEQHGGVIGIDATSYVMSNNSQDSVQTVSTPDRNMVRTLAESLDVQFVITGVFKNFAVIDKVFGDTRQLSLEVQVYDGISGAMISYHVADKDIEEGVMDADIEFGSSAFYQTALGKVLYDVMGQQVAEISSAINKLPVTVRVVRTEGRKVYFNAGVTSLINVGDMLMAYKVEDTPVFKTSGGMDFGYLESPVATVTVKTLQPLFAMGELETDEVRLGPGDLLRFGW